MCSDLYSCNMQSIVQKWFSLSFFFSPFFGGTSKTKFYNNKMSEDPIVPSNQRNSSQSNKEKILKMITFIFM